MLDLLIEAARKQLYRLATGKCCPCNERIGRQGFTRFSFVSARNIRFLVFRLDHTRSSVGIKPYYESDLLYSTR